MLQTTEIVALIAEKQEISKVQAKKNFDAVKEVIVEAIKRGEDIELKGFVNFESKQVAEGTARNPQNGEQVTVPAHRKASAKLAKSLRKF